MSKRKKQSANLNKQSKVKREIIQLEDCSKNDECGVSVVDDVKVIVFYNGPNYKVKISIPKRSITKKILKVQNSKFDLYIRFEDTDYSKSGGHLYIELKGRYKLDDRFKILSYIFATITLIGAIFIKNSTISNILLFNVLIESISISRLAYKLTKNEYGYETYTKQNALS